jgi:hypothetical protein
MPDEIVPQTANAEPAASAPAQEPVQQDPAASTPEPAAATDPKATPQIPEPKGAEPDGTPKVVDELKTQRRKRQEAERLAQDKAAEAAYYRGLAEGRQAAQPQLKPQAQVDKAPSLDDFDGDTAYEDYIVAKARYNIHQEQKQQEQKVQASTVDKTFNERCAKAAEATPDLWETLRDMPILPVNLRVGIMRHDMGPQIAYYLAKNPQEIVRLSQLDPEVASMELGAMQGNVKQYFQSKTKTVTQAPPPLPSSGGNGTTVETDLADLPTAEYAKRRLEQMHVRVGGKLVRQ